jgi:antitoxin Phd
MDWPLAEAKNKLSEVVERSLTEGPQRIRRRKDAVFVVSEETYIKLTGKKLSLVDYLLSAPKVNGFNPQRIKGHMRTVKL